MSVLQAFHHSCLTTAIKEFFASLQISLKSHSKSHKNSKIQVQNIDQTFSLISSTHEIIPPKLKVDDLVIYVVGILLSSHTASSPTRSDFVQISRALITKNPTHPLIIIFKYHVNQRDTLTFVITDDLISNKIKMLRDVHITHTHPSHLTILQQLLPSSVCSSKQRFSSHIYARWQQAFSVDYLCKAFYQELSDWYQWAIHMVYFPNPQDKEMPTYQALNLIQFMIRLLFVWLIKEKGLIPEYLFNRDELKKYGITASSTESNYYRQILHQLFCASWSQSEHLDQMIPFLNISLFKYIDDDLNLYLNEWEKDIAPNEQVIMPNLLLFQDESFSDVSYKSTGKTSKSKILKALGLVQILHTYQFTLIENTPFEEEIAIEAEILGKVFENLLASYAPHTHSSARKQTGSFYTPREIVHYMVEESLVAYLKNTKIAWGYDDASLDLMLHQLMRSEFENPFDHESSLSEQIIKALADCKVFDPACGSGAFLVGTLQKMLEILRKLDPSNQRWYAVQVQYAKNESTYEVPSKKMSIIDQVFDQNIYHADYARKFYLIARCLYGVDIQSLAIQITKIRLLISLMLESHTCIHILPYIHRNFVTANTLFTVDLKLDCDNCDDSDNNTYSDSGMIHQKINSLKHTLHDLQYELFNAYSLPERLKIKQKKKRIISDLTHIFDTYYNQYLYIKELRDQIIHWNAYQYTSDESASFFNASWMFDLSTGFDLIIGNPPYIGHKGGAKKMFRLLKKTPLGKQFNHERMDLFYYFFHLAINLSNHYGIITFLTTNYFLTADSARKLRDDIAHRTFPFLFVDFNQFKLFESAKGQHNLVSCLSKCKVSDKIKILSIETQNKMVARDIFPLLQGQTKESNHYEISHSAYRDPASGYFLIRGLSQDSQDVNQLLTYLSKNARSTLADHFDISQGVVTGIDKISPRHVKKFDRYRENLGMGVFIVSADFRDALPSQERTLLKPWFKNSEIHRYHVQEQTQRFLIHTHTDVDLTQYPTLTQHLEYFKDVILSRNYESGELSKAQRLGIWWALSSSRKDFDFTLPKIIAPQRSRSNIFGYTTMDWYASADVYFITKKPHTHITLEALLLFLNSKLVYLWLYHRGKRKGELLELYTTPLSRIPLPNLSEKEITIFTLIARLIIQTCRSHLLETEFFEKIAEMIVCEHYFREDMQAQQVDLLELLSLENTQISDAINSKRGILQLHQTWSQTSNEIYRRVQLFDIRKPRLVRVLNW